MSMLPLLTLYFPPNIREFCKNFVSLHGEPGFVPNFFQDHILTNPSRSTALNYNFEVLGYETPYFIINASKKITLTIAVLIMGPMVLGVATLL